MAGSETPRISVVVLTYNRLDSLAHVLGELHLLAYPGLEIIVVDNCSEIPADSLASRFEKIIFLKSPSNLGVGGRNIGIKKASSPIVVCLDDDVSGLTDSGLYQIAAQFRDPTLGALCFKVMEAETGQITNWVHHKPVEEFSNSSFDTYEITEGAVAFRRDVAESAGLYPESFFISHEGPDLAFRILNLGYRTVYSPAISVIHAYSPLARTSWRNYYYDTRNTFWLAARNCPLGFGVKVLVRQVGAMLLYSLRDGFFIWWLRAVRDGLRGLPQAFGERQPLSKQSMQAIRNMDRDRPGFVYLLRRRLAQQGVKI